MQERQSGERQNASSSMPKGGRRNARKKGRGRGSGALRGARGVITCRMCSTQLMQEDPNTVSRECCVVGVESWHIAIPRNPASEDGGPASWYGVDRCRCLGRCCPGRQWGLGTRIRAGWGKNARGRESESPVRLSLVRKGANRAQNTTSNLLNASPNAQHAQHRHP